jgi:hypothetical protein
MALLVTMLAIQACATNRLYYSYPEPRPLIKQAAPTLPPQRTKYELLSNAGALTGLIRWADHPVLESRGDVVRYRDELLFGAVFREGFYFAAVCPDPRALAWAALYFSKDESFSDFFVCDITAMLAAQAPELEFSRVDFKVGDGKPEWETCTFFQLAFQSQEGGKATIEPYYLASFAKKTR